MYHILVQEDGKGFSWNKMTEAKALQWIQKSLGRGHIYSQEELLRKDFPSQDHDVLQAVLHGGLAKQGHWLSILWEKLQSHFFGED